ncbi:hypothetical protein E4U54_003600 [Claviceps lovelessii]|nr:hypothetical protein E4U54_003600 [Claviceps lovelessii]
MRIARTLGTLCWAVMTVTIPPSASASPNASWSTGSSSSVVSAPLATGSCHGFSSTSNPYASGCVNSTFPVTTTATVPTNLINATTSHTAGVTGGAIPQQMQASMAGLLGFCIMGLVML